MSETTDSTAIELPTKHSDRHPWPAGTKVTGTFSVWDKTNWESRKRTVRIVSYDEPSADNGHWGSYTVRFADGTEDMAHPRWLTLAPAPRPKGAPKPERVKVVKPDKDTLPRIIAYDSFYDSGEYGNATCPHCGADGRYVWTFHCADGTKRGAMAGCIKLFKVSPIATEHKKLLERKAEREKTGGKLASWDVAKLEAITGLVDGTVTEGDCLRTIEVENAKRSRWIEGRNGNVGSRPRRRW